MANSAEHLQAMQNQLQSILKYLPHFGASTERLPIIDILHSGNNDDEDEEESAATGSDSEKNAPSERDGGSTDWNALRHPHTGIPGLRVFREIVRNDIEQIDKFLARHAQHKTTVSVSAFSTNAPYLVAVWNELVRARQPIVAIDKPFPVRLEERRMSNSKPAPPPNTFSRKGVVVAKVDVAADNGQHWIRVNTIKNARILAELRELDAYLTDLEPEDNDILDGSYGFDTSSCKSKPEPHELDNSLLLMGKQLFAAAQASMTISDRSSAPPRITLRLPRLRIDSNSVPELESLGLRMVGPREDSTTSKQAEIDPRITQTLRELLEMGIEIILGEHEFLIPPEFHSPPAKSQRRLVPSCRINLDLSVLIALISDITHAPLPLSEEEAYTRYIPTPAERARSRKRRQQQKELLARAKAHSKLHNLFGRKQSNAKDKAKLDLKEGAESSETDGEGENLHSRALASQVLREIDQALLDEIASRLDLAQDVISTIPSSSLVEFWTSKEVRDRCLRIVDKIGGPAEKRRAAALLSYSSNGTESVFGIQFHSPTEAVEAYWHDSRHPPNLVPGLVPVRIYDRDENDTNPAKSACKLNENFFWANLEQTCTRLLAEGSTHHARALAALHDSSSPPDTNRDHSANGSKQEDQSILADEIDRAAVTSSNPRLTAHTVGTLHRGIQRRWTTLTANRAGVREILKESAKAVGGQNTTSVLDSSLNLQEKVSSMKLDDDETETAAIWIVEPRSLAETMRGDFTPP